MRMAMGSFGVIPIPLGILGLITFEPLEEPVLRASQFLINGDRRFSL
jgi:hypothetical protein